MGSYLLFLRLAIASLLSASAGDVLRVLKASIWRTFLGLVTSCLQNCANIEFEHAFQFGY